MYTKLLLTLVLPLLLVSGPYQDYQKIRLDDKYNNVQPSGSKTEPLHYSVKPGKGLILDCTGYDFSAIRKMNDGKDPDRIHFICKSGSFDIDLNTKGETVIDESTTTYLGNDHKKFHGLEKGDKIILGIGGLDVKGETAHMLTYWVALMDVE